jgi:hypothetical protein
VGTPGELARRNPGNLHNALERANEQARETRPKAAVNLPGH